MVIDYAYVLRYLIYINLRFMVKSKKPAKKDEKPKKPQQKSGGDSVLSRKWHHVPVVLIGLTSLLIVTGVIISLLVSINNSGDDESATTTLDSNYEGTDVTYKQQSEIAYGRGSIDEAQAVLTEGAEAAQGNDEAQADFYLRKAELALNANELEDALEFAEQAEQLHPTVSSAALAGLAAQFLGENEKAIDYYTSAADRTPEELKDQNSFGSDYGSYLSKIEALGGKYEEN